ncbi:GNAT family N-acetyltransferase [Leptolyngbyaceae cyanobacterium CCMR0082]|uniref:GNAT family N-acetyltransferase n=2 Tax=Adonisia turfae TaxID=2950184 RepID=A0A6M0S5Q6_9CYAN|nr:GNAT family N-acetyltransferase [Adonisia turfae]MDV3353468.1 GNAT family N-acetyltransferase [Leptothoe sp. LEGE 181152]NEZ56726.1 GNAT family N-acetyltransferase [Adonisia turfae CCMR0081]NEZ63735.1 GNAT family N-acetyltransferase [Adonisia turfae CCMR0082]
MVAPITISPATRNDIPLLFELVMALAEYENLAHEVSGAPEDLEKYLFGDSPKAHAIVARIDGAPAGFALYFFNFSTFLMKPGIYLEDLFVLPGYRRRGIGTAIFQYLAQTALAKGCGRFEWSVLDWNQPAIDFYRSKGAVMLNDWRTCRVAGIALEELASSEQ